MRAEPRTVRETPVSTLLDGNGVLGHGPEGSSYKSYGLAAMVNILNSCLSGSTLVTDLQHGKKPQGIDLGRFMLARKPALFRGEARSRRTWRRSATRCGRHGLSVRGSRSGGCEKELRWGRGCWGRSRERQV